MEDIAIKLCNISLEELQISDRWVMNVNMARTHSQYRANDQRLFR